jgi:hypothetical protein
MRTLQAPNLKYQPKSIFLSIVTVLLYSSIFSIGVLKYKAAPVLN